MKIQIEKRLGLCKVCGFFYKCKPSDFPTTKYCSRRCQLKDYAIRDRKDKEVGNVYGILTVISYLSKDHRGNLLWKCRCLCGSEGIFSTTYLRTGRKKDCGCLRKD